ncbi:MAG: tRNA (5-methylaminomethyl-2-thiouridine)(34)-methyltransferase MnmD [Candidatus Omnitrophica bacterium]|nr:tRNA (5-methylaminomethyl-2-thiouridine)(34)-methyltransferase MnmD [Candidatus Omnitrophota bacterium]
MSENVILTQDGSSTLYSAKYQDHYHSTYGALRESRHVFIDAGLRYCQSYLMTVSILEIGLGTGLNVMLTGLQREGTRIDYTVIEPEPVAPELLLRLNYVQQLGGEDHRPLFERIHDSPWNTPVSLETDFTLTKFAQTVQEFNSPGQFDLIYFDAFSPSVQPEVWTEDVFKRLFGMCRPRAVLVTYSSKGAVRRAMAMAGFKVEKLPGPLGKREMVRAQKP